MKKGTISFSAFGRWRQKNEEIDLVALDEGSDTIWFGECKWSVNPVGEDLYRTLQRKTFLVFWGSEQRRERFILFSRSGFTDGMRALAAKDEVLLVEGETLLTSG